MKTWPLQDAKAKLSDLVKSAETEGPQEISVRGRPAVVVLSCRKYERLKSPKPRFVDFLRASPLLGARLRVRRDRSPARRVDL